VEGVLDAGFAMSIILIEPATLKKEPPKGDIKADLFIKVLGELLDIFPPR
jgi:hypothetical protein